MVGERQNFRSNNLPCFMPLTGHTKHIAFLQHLHRLADGKCTIPNLKGRRTSSNNLFANFIRIFRARIIISHNGNISKTSRNLAHQRTFTRIPITATPQHTDQATSRKWAQGCKHILQRFRLMSIINKHQSAVFTCTYMLNPARCTTQHSQRFKNSLKLHTSRNSQPRSNQGIAHLKITCQRQGDREHTLSRFQLKNLTEALWLNAKHFQIIAKNTSRKRLEAALFRNRQNAVSKLRFRINNNHTIIRQKIAEQTQFCLKVVFHRWVVVHVVSAKVGKASCNNVHAIKTMLVQPVTGRLQGRMGNPILCQTLKVFMQRHRVRCGQAAIALPCRCDSTNGSKTGRNQPGIFKDLTHENSNRRFARSACHSNHLLRLFARESSRHQSKFPARILCSDQRNLFGLLANIIRKSVRINQNGSSTRVHGLLDKLRTINFRALKGSKNKTGLHCSTISSKPRNIKSINPVWPIALGGDYLLFCKVFKQHSVDMSGL
ncbi:hypothetical protein PsW64_01823 [Pseudovibrio sp. W64]|nr:hypothetical protein PsW64_01823 [Pseudovibrio sp. W64]